MLHSQKLRFKGKKNYRSKPRLKISTLKAPKKIRKMLRGILIKSVQSRFSISEK